MTPILTRHANARSQQRGIPVQAIEQVLGYGREHHDRHGGVVVMLDRRGRERLARTGVDGPALERLSGVYVVTTRGVVATVGHRHRRLRRR